MTAGVLISGPASPGSLKRPCLGGGLDERFGEGRFPLACEAHFAAETES